VTEHRDEIIVFQIALICSASFSFVQIIGAEYCGFIEIGDTRNLSPEAAAFKH
jgi:hypothetical protein